MKLKRHNNISENQIEDAFVANLSFLQEILNLPNELKLISRQLWLKAGTQRLDLLFLSGKDLCLVELKVENFSYDFVLQTCGYVEELKNLQLKNDLIAGNIKAYLLVTDAPQNNIEYANERNVRVVIYEPLNVLNNYFQNLSAVAPFLQIKPNDYGVFSLGLINRAIIKLYEGLTKQAEIAKRLNLSRGSVHNHLKLSIEFGLVRERNNNYFLTDLGDNYVRQSPKGILLDKLSMGQIEILKQFISKDPFYSSSVFGVYSIVESVFILSRNVYPINLEDLQKMFSIVSGKVKEWKAQKSLSTVTYTFLNYAIDLELLGKMGKKIVITPSGFRFILMLQLHKSLEMIEGLSLK